MRILVIEDSTRLRQSVSTWLRRNGFSVDASADGEEGLYLAETNDYDIIVLDIMLPKLDGLALLQRLRKQGKQTHVLLLTAKDTVPDRVRGLELGADDYLVKPFALEELLARVKALCRRAYGSKDSRLAVADLEIDTTARKAQTEPATQASKPGETIRLPWSHRGRPHLVPSSSSARSGPEASLCEGSTGRGPASVPRSVRPGGAIHPTDFLGANGAAS